ncbi:MAG: biopolymer transporter ExbD, partial [Nevskia sp.]|nr:biopolymer transporter ExbD [Nevskia sp.]
MRMRSNFMRQRMLRKAEKRDTVPLNLVSMIDIFTCLVFFLLLTSTSVQTMKNPRSLELPSSITNQTPNDTPVLMVTAESIMLQGHAVMSVKDAEATGGDVLPDLKSRLLLVPLAQIQGGPTNALTRGEINIMADKGIPYSLLKKVMITAGQAQFAKISLSVNHRSTRAPA